MKRILIGALLFVFGTISISQAESLDGVFTLEQQQQLVQKHSKDFKEAVALHFAISFIKGAKYAISQSKSGHIPSNAEIIKAAEQSVNESAHMLGWIKEEAMK